MKPETKKRLIAILTHAKQFISKESIHDYASLKKRVLRYELEQHIVVIERMLEASKPFKVEFKNLLAQREAAHEANTSFATIPQSPTNQLLWKIAELVFKPQHLGEMLTIITPHVKVSIQLHFDMLPAEDKKQRIQPRLETLPNLSLLNEPPTLIAFTHCALADDAIFRVADLANLPLHMHAEVHTQFQTCYPELAKKIYTHNQDLRILSTDIELFNKTSFTFRNIIKKVIHAFILGGSSTTGNVYASKGAEHAKTLLFDYFNALPHDIQQDLQKLKMEYLTLGNILENLRKGHCVETAAGDFKGILNYNPSHPLLDLPLQISAEALKRLIEKYRFDPRSESVLRTNKNASQHHHLPSVLIEMVLAEIAVSDRGHLLDLLLSLPTALYKAFFQYAKLTFALTNLELPLQNGLFNEEQKRELALGVFNFNNRSLNVIVWALSINDSVFLNAILDDLDSAEWLRLRHLETNWDESIYVFALRFQESFKALISRHSNEEIRLLLNERFSNLSFKNVSLLYAAVWAEGMVEFILNLLPIGERLMALNCSAPIRVLNHPHLSEQTIRNIIALLSPTHRLIAFLPGGNSSLFHKLHTPALFIRVFELLLESDRLAFIAQPKFFSLLMQKFTQAAELGDLLYILSEPQQLAFLKAIINSHHPFLFLSPTETSWRILEKKNPDFMAMLNNRFPQSFMVSFINIYLYLTQQAALENSQWYFFRKRTDANLLLAQINQLQTLSKVRDHIYRYLLQNKSPLQIQLLNCLDPHDRSDYDFFKIPGSIYTCSIQ